jgi:integrase
MEATMAARELHKLSAKQVEKERAPGRYSDGGGLYLQVQDAIGRKAVTKSWLFRFTRSGTAREMGLGALHTVNLAEARKRAAACRLQLLDGVDPIDARAAARSANASAAGRLKTFKECAEAYIKAHRSAWKNPKHADQWSNTLATYAYEKLGSKPVAVVDADHIVEVLQSIWTTKNETASRLRGRIEAVLDWAAVMKYREGLNPARWRGHLDHALPKVSRLARIQHHAALPFAEVPEFIKDLRKEHGVAALALEFTILTAARTGEAIGATWDEIDKEARVWIVPGERMKAKREHRVPLSKRAMEILAAAEKLPHRDHIFPGRDRRPMSNMAMLKTLERMKREDLTVHGFRSSFRDWASESTTFPREVVEMALAHAIPDKVEAAYRRGDLFEKRRRLMDAWASFCEKPVGTVHELKGAKKV